MTKIYIDAGHGGTDPGASGHGLKEKDLTLKISKRIAAILKDYEVDVKLSRTGDQTLSLKQRTDAANKWGADYLLSVHINAGGGTGYEDFVYNGGVSANTVKYRDIIHAEVTKQLGNVRNRGKKKANFHMVRESRMPAMLSENLFIDTKTDADLLKKDSYLDKVALGHANGLIKVLNLKAKAKPTPTPTPTPTPKPSKPSNSGKQVYHRVVAGSYKDRKNAEAQIAKLKKLGVDGVFLTTHEE